MDVDYTRYTRTVALHPILVEEGIYHDKHRKNHLFVLSRVFYQIILAMYILSYCTATGPD